MSNKKWNHKNLLKTSIICLVMLSILSFLNQYSTVYASCEITSANIMAPLYLTNTDAWNHFRSELSSAKNIGIDSVTVDVWWGLVEGAGDNQFEWAYYEKVFKAIKDEGLHIIPIFSFHRCGGGPGDDCNIPLPNWVWTSTPLSKQNLQFKSEKGNYSEDAISVWTSYAVMNQYVEFMNAFEDKFGNTFAGIVDELNISLGPTGELRYPAYGPHDSWQYPNRGYFQSYEDKACDSFRNYAVSNFGGLAGTNARWNTTLTNIDQIGLPDDGTPHDGRAESFVDLDDYFDTQYGKDYIDWYNWSLVNHGQKMIEAAHAAFNGPFKDIPLGVKIPGVHWQMDGRADNPRIAEITAGLIQTSIDFWSQSKAHGYESILNMVENVKNSLNRDVIFHFTALEKDNMEWDSGKHAWSMAKELVHYIARGAAERKLILKGENALAAGICNDHGWGNIKDAFNHYDYCGFTLLRINEWNDTAKNQYKNLIKTCECQEWTEAYFRGTSNCWGHTPMTKNTITKLWNVEQAFSGGNPRFKISHYTNWDEAYPGADYPITEGEGTYKITFNEETKKITATKLDDPPPQGSLNVHYKEFEYVSGNYIIHTYNGFTGDYTMTYEGAYDGGHWWKTQLTTPSPSHFQFCFTNSNGNWDGLDRTYDRTSCGNEIWVRNKSTEILTSKP